MARNHAQGQGSHGEPGRKLRQDEQDGQDARMEDRELKKGASESVPSKCQSSLMTQIEI